MFEDHSVLKMLNEAAENFYRIKGKRREDWLRKCGKKYRNSPCLRQQSTGYDHKDLYNNFDNDDRMGNVVETLDEPYPDVTKVAIYFNRNRETVIDFKTQTGRAGRILPDGKVVEIIDIYMPRP